ncbi:MAG: hypothetical protein H6923_03295 [Alphaproteobacteria bacterium]|nr:hypothetical protein [Alphaproteobacteria bacterium]
MSAIGRIFWIVLLAFGILLAVLFVRYQSLDPCTMLAKERTKNQDAELDKNLGVKAGEPLERLNRAVMSQRDAGECVGDLVEEWGKSFSGGDKD